MTVRYDTLFKLTLHTFTGPTSGVTLSGTYDITTTRLPPWFLDSLIVGNMRLLRAQEGDQVALEDITSSATINYDEAAEQMVFSFVFNSGTEFQTDDSIIILLDPPPPYIDQSRGFDGPNFYPRTTGLSVDKATYLIQWLASQVISGPTTTPVVPVDPVTPPTPTIIETTWIPFFVTRNDYVTAQEAVDGSLNDSIAQGQAVEDNDGSPVTITVPNFTQNAYLMFYGLSKQDQTSQGPDIIGIYSGDSATGINQVGAWRYIAQHNMGTNYIRYYVSENRLLPSLSGDNITIDYEF